MNASADGRTSWVRAITRGLRARARACVATAVLVSGASASAVPPGHVTPAGPSGAAVWHGGPGEPSLKQLQAAQAAMAPHFAECMEGTPRGMTRRLMVPAVFAPTGEVTWTFLSDPPADYEQCLDQAARRYMHVPPFSARSVLVLFPLGETSW